MGTSQYSHGTGFINFGGWDPVGRDITFLQEQVSSSVHVLAQGSTLLLQTVLTSSIAVHSRLTTQHLQHFFGQVSARGDVRHAAWNVRHATCSINAASPSLISPG